MQQYELLCVLPGTLAENEVEPVASTVRTIVTERGGTISLFADLGKTRLSYPMKHIRYGYFRLCRFSAEEKDVFEIERRLRMKSELLRILLTKLNPHNAAMNTIQFVAPLQGMERGERGEGVLQASEAVAPAVALPEEMTAQPATAPAQEKEDKRMKLEDIDKKLDEILEKGITDQL